jgi:lysophospholipase L1-like esterase
MNKPLPLWSRFSKLLAANVLVLTASSLATPALADEAPDPDAARFESAIRAFDSWDSQNAFPRDGVLFVGSSSIRMWRTAESFPDLPVINRGFGGSHISDVVHYVDRVVLKYAPRGVVFYAGDNDIAAGKSPERVARDFRRFVEIVHQLLPATRIYYLPIKPSVARWKLWPQMQEANALIAHLCDNDERLEYIDTATPMLGDDGQPRKDLLIDDGLHLNAEGYRVWTTIVHPYLEQPDAID